MALGAIVLVEPSLAGNLGAALRLAANFGVAHVELVRPGVPPDHPEVRRWACGGGERVEVRCYRDLADALRPYRCSLASASGRGRANQPLVTPGEAVHEVSRRGLEATALVLGNETRGLSRVDLDRCDLVVRVPTVPEFPVLNLAQAVAILVAYLSLEVEPPEDLLPPPASQARVDGLMGHLRASLARIGFLDPGHPARILRKLRRLLGRAGATDNEVAILRGICRQIDWAADRAGLQGTVEPDGQPPPPEAADDAAHPDEP
jgi:TrmH family RNA methyltransferase